MEFSTYIDEAVLWGTRDELIEEGISLDRLDRADKYGSSSFIGSDRWEDSGLVLAQVGWLPRGRYSDYLDVLTEQWKMGNFDVQDPRILSLLEPLED